MKLLTLTLSAVDLEQMRQFYTGFLGLREAEPYWTGRLSIQAGHSRLNFTLAPPGWRGYYHFAFDVPPDRFEAAQRWLRERVTPIASPEGETVFQHESWHAQAVYFRDPSGNILELIARQRTPEGEAAMGQPDENTPPAPPLDPARPFSAREIIGVTEIGLAVGSVADAVAELTERMPGLAVYSGAGSDQFTAVGDIDGLFIVVLIGRIWFPNTGVPAVALPVEALAEVKKGKTLQQRYLLQAPPYPFIINPAP